MAKMEVLDSRLSIWQRPIRMREAVDESPGISDSAVRPATGASPLRTASVWLLLLSPFLVTTFFVASYGVNVPFLDEWLMPYVFRMVREGTHGFGEVFWPPNNEHRIVVPKIIWTGLGFLTNYNVKVNMFVSLGFVLAAYLGIARLAKRFAKPDIVWWRIAVLTTGVLLFSLVHYETWLMGFQFGYISALCFTLGAILVLKLPAWRPWLRLGIAAALCFLASFSSGQGLISWIVILPSVFFAFDKPKRIWACTAMVGGLLLTAVVYRIDYHPPTVWQSDRSLILKQPFQVIAFAFALLGAPFCQAFGMDAAMLAPWIGGMLCGGFLLLTLIYVWQGRTDRVACWLSIGLMGVGCAGLTALGRADWGVSTVADLSRYMICMIWLPIGFIHLFGSLATSPLWRRIAIFVAGVMVVLQLGAYSRAWHKGRASRAQRALAASFLEVERYIDKKTDNDERSLLYPLFPCIGYTGSIRLPAEMLGEDGLRKIERHATFEEHSPIFGCCKVDAANEAANSTTNAPDVVLSGWAVLPDRTLPKIVLISAGDERTFIAGARVGKVKRLDVAAAMNNPALRWCGWQTKVCGEFLPAGKSELKAWVYDGARSRFLRLTNCTAAQSWRL